MPRKPQQARSRQTYDAIIQAAYIALAKNGAESTTTRQIADIAGIGVGSLYEYFENKQAILDALIEHFAQAIAAHIKALTPSLVRIPLTDAVYELTLKFAEFLKANDEQYLKCARSLMLYDNHTQLSPVYRALGELFTKHAIAHPEQLQLKNLPTVAYIFINSGVYSMTRYLSHPNPAFSFEELAQVLANMAGHYVAMELKQGNN